MQEEPPTLDYRSPAAPLPSGAWTPPATALIGGLLGLILTGLGFAAAGAGHGCYVLLGLASSPAGLLDDFLVTLCATPLFWAVIGFLMPLVRYTPSRIAFVVLMLVHYAAAVIILTDPDHFGDWSYLPRVGTLIFMGFGVYAAMQIFAWWMFARIVRGHRADSSR